MKVPEEGITEPITPERALIGKPLQVHKSVLLWNYTLSSGAPNLFKSNVTKHANSDTDVTSSADTMNHFDMHDE